MRGGTVVLESRTVRAANRERLWQLVLDGTVDLIASDHSPSAAAETMTDDIWTTWGGITGVQSLQPALLTGGVHRCGLSLARLAALDRAWTLTREQLQARSDLSPYVGRVFRGAVVRTLVRGRTVFADGGMVAKAGAGRFVRAF